MRYEEDEIDALGWFVAMVFAAGWLVFAVVYMMHKAGWI